MAQLESSTVVKPSSRTPCLQSQQAVGGEGKTTKTKMLAADKLQLQSAFKQQATALKEKEFQLHHSNLSKYLKLILRAHEVLFQWY